MMDIMCQNYGALIVLSGEQDSTTCLFWAIQQFGRENIRALGFLYGQRNHEELSAAKEICAGENIPYAVIDLSALGELTENAMTRPEMAVDGAAYTDDYPNTFVDGRNHIFLSYAAIYAKKHRLRNIITGVCQTDFSGYPDCRDVFIKSLNVTLNLAMDYDFNIITPLMWMDKAEVWSLAESLGCIDIIVHKTLTCYEGIAGKGCGKCPACTLRRRGYEKYLDLKSKRNDENEKSEK